MEAIVTKKLSKQYRSRVVVNALDLEVRQGEVFGFLGPNGAGKTTTIGMLLGLVAPTSGQVFVLGHDVSRAPTKALRNVGAMIEAPAFYPYLSGRDNLRALALASRASARGVDAALDVVDLGRQAKDRFATYSLGMRQRLGLAAALLGEPRLILLDEPTNGLDPAGQQDIRTLVRSLADSGRTIFLCSHMLHEVEQVCDRVAILKQGVVIAQGQVAELLRRGHGVFVRVATGLEQARALIEQLDWVARVSEHDGGLLLDTPVERSPELTMLLAAHAIPVAEIRAHHLRLEEVFLELTQP